MHAMRVALYVARHQAVSTMSGQLAAAMGRLRSIALGNDRSVPAVCQGQKTARSRRRSIQRADCVALEIRERATSPPFKSVTNPSLPLSRHFSFSIAYSLFDSRQVIEHPRSARMPSNEIKTTQPHHQVRHTAHGDYGIPGCSWQ